MTTTTIKTTTTTTTTTTTVTATITSMTTMMTTTSTKTTMTTRNILQRLRRLWQLWWLWRLWQLVCWWLDVLNSTQHLMQNSHSLLLSSLLWERTISDDITVLIPFRKKYPFVKCKALIVRDNIYKKWVALSIQLSKPKLSRKISPSWRWIPYNMW